MQESLDKAIAFSFKTYYLINGIKGNVENRDLRNNESGNKLLDISRQKYKLLTGASVIPKTSDKKEEYKGFKEKALVLFKRQYIL